MRLSDVSPVSTGSGGGATADAEALEDLLQVGLHREEAAAQDEAALDVGFPRPPRAAPPAEDLSCVSASSYRSALTARTQAGQTHGRRKS